MGYDVSSKLTSTSRHSIEMQLFTNSTAQRHGHTIHELVDIHQVCVTTGQVLCVSQSALTSWNNADFEKWVSIFEVPTANSMSSFMVSDGLLLLWVEDKRLLFQTTNDTLDGLFEVLHRDRFGVETCGWNIKC